MPLGRTPQPYPVRGQRASSAREWHQIASRPVFLIVAIIAVLAAPCAEASNLAVDPQNPATLYHASERGVFKSTDGGATWSPRNAGFPRQERSFYVNVLAWPRERRGTIAGRTDLGARRQSLPMKIDALGDAARSVVDSLAVGERSHITIRPDCNTCRCDVQRISPTEYVTAGCACTLMGC